MQWTTRSLPSSCVLLGLWFWMWCPAHCPCLWTVLDARFFVVSLLYLLPLYDIWPSSNWSPLSPAYSPVFIRHFYHTLLGALYSRCLIGIREGPITGASWHHSMLQIDVTGSLLWHPFNIGLLEATFIGKFGITGIISAAAIWLQLPHSYLCMSHNCFSFPHWS